MCGAVIPPYTLSSVCCSDSCTIHKIYVLNSVCFMWTVNSHQSATPLSPTLSHYQHDIRNSNECPVNLPNSLIQHIYDRNCDGLMRKHCTLQLPLAWHIICTYNSLKLCPLPVKSAKVLIECIIPHCMRCHAEQLLHLPGTHGTCLQTTV